MPSNRNGEAEIGNDGPGPEIQWQTRVARGKVLFAKDWVPNDPKSPGGDGLGPVYNETSCVACHGQGAPGGAGPGSKNVVLVTASLTGPDKARDLDQIHPGFRGGRSTVLHRYGTDPGYGSWRRRFYDSRPRATRQTLARIRSRRGSEGRSSKPQRVGGCATDRPASSR